MLQSMLNMEAVGSYEDYLTSHLTAQHIAPSSYSCVHVKFKHHVLPYFYENYDLIH
jgi:hypothetical protein